MQENREDGGYATQLGSASLPQGRPNSVPEVGKQYGANGEQLGVFPKGEQIAVRDNRPEDPSPI